MKVYSGIQYGSGNLPADRLDHGFVAYCPDRCGKRDLPCGAGFIYRKGHLVRAKKETAFISTKAEAV